MLRTRRRPRYICALVAAVLLLLSVGLLHNRLLKFPLPRHDYDQQDNTDPLHQLDDTDPLPLNNKSTEDRIDALDDDDTNSNNNEEVLAEEEDEDAASQSQVFTPPATTSSNYFFDHVNSVVRRSFNHRSIDEWVDYVPFSDLRNAAVDPAFGSDDVLVDEKLRNKLTQLNKIEDALLLKGSALREGWGEWFDKKADFLRRDRMFKSNIELLNPLNNPSLQDPDGPGVTGLTTGDRVLLKAQMSFLFKKTLSFPGSQSATPAKWSSNIVSKRVSGADSRRRTLNNDHYITSKVSREGSEKLYYADGKRWGYYPGLDGGLSFRDFMDTFFRRGRCTMRIFMVWNSPAWMFGVRQQRGLESLLYHHRDACVVVFSETIELNFFNGFVKDGYKVAVVMPDLDELLKDTPAHEFASVWHEWRKTKHYPTHYSELVRLASIYKYGGTYLDSDVIVLKQLYDLNNTVGFEDERVGKSLNGAVMAFRKNSPFILKCLAEFYASYDDEKLRWNGAALLTRVANSFLSDNDNSDAHKELVLQPSSVFFPIGHNDIPRYLVAPGTESEKDEQNALLRKIMDQSVTVHCWNSLTSALIPEPESLVFKLLNLYCIRCSEAL